MSNAKTLLNISEAAKYLWVGITTLRKTIRMELVIPFRNSYAVAVLLWTKFKPLFERESEISDSERSIIMRRPIFSNRKKKSARPKSSKQKAPPVSTPMLKLDSITLDLDHHRVIGRRGIRRLTPKEAELLAEFMRHPEETLTRSFLMKHVWQTDFLGDTRTLNVHIRWVREKIEDDPSRPKWLKTVRGVGYRFGIPRS